MSIKKQAYEILLLALQHKIAAIENDLLAIKESISNETKSTAGDKYETARAMLHIEQENVMKQLANAQNQKHELTAVDTSQVASVVRHGSLVTTNYGIFFIATAMGKIVVDEPTSELYKLIEQEKHVEVRGPSLEDVLVKIYKQ